MELRAFRQESEIRYHNQEASINKLAEDIKEIRYSITNLDSKYNILRTDVDQLLETSDTTSGTLATIQLQCDDSARRLADLEIKDYGCEIMIQRQRIDTIEKQIAVNEKSSNMLTSMLNNNSHKLLMGFPDPMVSPQEFPHPLLPPVSSVHSTASLPLISNEQPSKNTYYNTRIFTTGNSQPRPRRSVIRATGAADTDLKTLEPVKYIHAWNFHPDVSVESIQSYLHKKHPNNTFSIKKPEPGHSRHNCFILGVPLHLFEYYLSPNNWPTNTSLQEWFTYRNAKKKVESDDANKTFFRDKN